MDLALDFFDLVVNVPVIVVVIVGTETVTLGVFICGGDVFLGGIIGCGRAQVFFGALGGRPRSLHREEGVVFVAIAVAVAVAAAVVERGVVPHLNVVHAYCRYCVFEVLIESEFSCIWNERVSSE